MPQPDANASRLGRIRLFLQQVEQARRHYRAPRLATHLRALVLRHRGKFSTQEMWSWGLLNPSLDAAALQRYVSKRRFLRFQASHSPKMHAVLVEDKEVFYRFCEAIALPVPQTIAFVSRTSVWFARGHEAGTVVRLQARLHDLEGCELIIKPADGVYGIGIRALLVRDGGFVEDGRPLSLAELMRELPADTRHVLQRRLANHASVEALTGFRTLQTVRVVTALPARPGARAQLLSAALRLSGSDSVANNFNFGRTGAVRATIDIDTGCIVNALRASPSGFGLEPVERIDGTGAVLAGTQLPHWAQLKAMMETKATCFYPIRLVGWDVALTPTGPVVLEGNFWFDPGNATAIARDCIEQCIAMT
jgi:hypothetical protein